MNPDKFNSSYIIRYTSSKVYFIHILHAFIVYDLCVYFSSWVYFYAMYEHFSAIQNETFQTTLFDMSAYLQRNNNCFKSNFRSLLKFGLRNLFYTNACKLRPTILQSIVTAYRYQKSYQKLYQQQNILVRDCSSRYCSWWTTRLHDELIYLYKCVWCLTVLNRTRTNPHGHMEEGYGKFTLL